MKKDPKGNEGAREDKRTRVRGRAPELSPEVVRMVEKFCETLEQGAPSPFRNHVERLVKQVGIPSQQLYSALRSKHAPLFNRMNRLRTAWYEHRDAAVRNAKLLSEQAVSVRLGLHPSTIGHGRRRRKETGRKHRGARWKMTDAESEALDLFEEAVERFESEKDLPYRTLAAVQDFAAALDLTNRTARECIHYLRPDLWARYQKQRARYSAALDRECLGDGSVALIADRYELAETTVRKHRVRLKARAAKKRQAEEN